MRERRARRRRARSAGPAPWLVGLSGLVWLAFGLAAVVGLHPALPGGGPARWGMGLTALLTAGALFGVAVRLRQGSRPAFWLAVFLLVGVGLVSLLDEFGWVDALVLALHLAALTLLLRDRERYLEGGQVDTAGE